ncbi:transposase for insertion sequence element IS431 [Staphylococcus aureus]|nr:transposase for insertion sequence element IS431 [Staphylococcus aureus]
MNYFRYKQFDKDVITVAVGYYLRYALSYRDISEILRERGQTKPLQRRWQCPK